MAACRNSNEPHSAKWDGREKTQRAQRLKPTPRSGSFCVLCTALGPNHSFRRRFCGLPTGGTSSASPILSLGIAIRGTRRARPSDNLVAALPCWAGMLVISVAVSNAQSGPGTNATPAGARALTITRIGFNPQRTEAILVIDQGQGPLGGEQAAYYLKKQNGRWLMVRSMVTRMA